MLALVDPEYGLGCQFSDEQQDNAVCFTPGFSPGKMQPPEPTGFSRKAWRSQARGLNQMH
ncbi:hypothetical protein DSECCO2_418900 [anaerobic digester metagenome]